jgi:hypothetical protein
MSYVFQSTIARSLKKTLNKIIDDKLDGYKAAALMPKWMDEGTMEDAYVDDLEMGGPGLMTEKLEGQDVPMGTIAEGAMTRYLARTYALGLAVTEEALEDGKYDEVIRAAVRLKRAGWVTVDVDSTQVLVRMFSTSYPTGDGVALASASHTLPTGGTWSNLMSVAMSPSRAAMQIAATQINKFPGHDGIVGSSQYKPACVLCPVDQQWAWKIVLGSGHAPEPGEFNAINPVNTEMKLDLYPNVFWNNTTTNWAVKTDADNGFRWLWRRKFRSKTWVNNEQGIMKYSNDARWSRGVSDPRAVLGVNA